MRTAGRPEIDGGSTLWPVPEKTPMLCNLSTRGTVMTHPGCSTNVISQRYIYICIQLHSLIISHNVPVATEVTEVLKFNPMTEFVWVFPQ